MSSVIILSIVIGTILAEGVDKRECEKIFDPRQTLCCKTISDLQDKLLKSDKLKECFQMKMDPISCEHDICIAKNRGYATNDNKLDKKKIEEMAINDLGSDADLVKDLKSKCYNGDLNSYGPSEFCDLFKMRLCMTVQVLKHCSEWDDTETCNEFKGLVQECTKSIF